MRALQLALPDSSNGDGFTPELRVGVTLVLGRLGTGKSTFARELISSTGVPFDAVQWREVKPGESETVPGPLLLSMTMSRGQTWLVDQIYHVSQLASPAWREALTVLQRTAQDLDHRLIIVARVDRRYGTLDSIEQLTPGLLGQFTKTYAMPPRQPEIF